VYEFSFELLDACDEIDRHAQKEMKRFVSESFIEIIYLGKARIITIEIHFISVLEKC
jgi:hypothetical protein